MANAGAFESGYQQGADIIAHRRARKEELSDEERQSKAQMYGTQLAGLRDKLANQKKGTPEYDETFKAMQDTLGNVRQLFHPDHAPGALAKFGHHITDALKITSPEGRREAEAQRRISASDSDERKARLFADSAPMSEEETAVHGAEAQQAGALASVRAGQKGWIALNPTSTPEEQAANLNLLIQQHFGITGKGSWVQISGKMNGQPTVLNYDKNTNRYTYQDGQPVPSEYLDPQHWTPEPKQTAYTQQHEQYMQAVADGYKGSELQWAAEQRTRGTQAGRPETLDKQYQAILVKKAAGTPLTPDEQAHESAWKIWNQETKIDPGVARAAAFGAMRYIPVVDPSNPNKVVMMRAGDAAKDGVGTPASIAFQTDKAITRYMTSGAGGTNIAYFNTATDHLRLLGQAGRALNNGQVPLFNQLANRFATATGDPAPTNFETVKAAVAGELSKTFKGTGATDAEIADINTTINQAQSPEQIVGAIDYYTRLMGGKLAALKTQLANARSGNIFGESGDSGSDAPKANATKKHKIKIGDKFYIYNGTGDTADMKNYTEVPK